MMRVTKQASERQSQASSVMSMNPYESEGSVVSVRSQKSNASANPKKPRKPRRVRHQEYKNIYAPIEFLRVMHRTKEFRHLSDMCLSRLWDKALLQVFAPDLQFKKMEVKRGGHLSIHAGERSLEGASRHGSRRHQ